MQICLTKAGMLDFVLAGWPAASRARDEACSGESQTGPGEHCTAVRIRMVGHDDEIHDGGPSIMNNI